MNKYFEVSKIIGYLTGLVVLFMTFAGEKINEGGDILFLALFFLSIIGFYETLSYARKGFLNKNIKNGESIFYSLILVIFIGFLILLYI